MVDKTEYDFLDFGSGQGGCANYAVKKLKGRSHLCFELEEEAVKRLNSMGHPCICADVTKLKIPEKSVRFVTISHVLEHLPTLDHAFEVLRIATSAARDFVFIEGPTFDFDRYLKGLGFKFFWYDSCGHTARVTTKHINRWATKLKVRHRKWLIEKPFIANSLAPDIIPFGEPAHPNRYNPKLHAPKTNVAFSHSVFRSWICFLVLKNIDYTEQLVRSRSKFELI